MPSQVRWDGDGEAGRFECTVHAERERVRLALAGELDVATAAEVRDQLAELVEAGFSHVVVDLRALRFIDSTGLRAILQTRMAMDTAGRRLSVWTGAPEIRRIFEVTGTDGLLSEPQDGSA